jgi:hypothetical protein
VPCARNSAPPIFSPRLEHVDEQAADGLALGLGVGDAGELAQKIASTHPHAPAGCCSGRGTDRPRSCPRPCPQQAVIDEHAGELVADRLVDQHRGDRGIDAAGQAADHPALADLGADFLDRLLAERAMVQSPVSPATSCGRNCGSAWRRRACAPLRGGTSGRNSARLVGDHRERRVGDDAGHDKTRRQLVMRSPWLIQTGWRSPGAQVESNSGLSALTSTSARPNSR